MHSGLVPLVHGDIAVEIFFDALGNNYVLLLCLCAFLYFEVDNLTKGRIIGLEQL